MNVLFLDQFSELGGAQHCLLDLIPALRLRDWRACAALPGGGPLVERLRDEGISVDAIPCGPYRSGGKSVGDLLRFPADLTRQTRIIKDLIHRRNVDLIYANGPRLWPAAALAAQGRIPILTHAHSSLGRGYALRMAGWSIRRARARVVACSHSVAHPLVRYARAGDLHVIPNGTEDRGFRRRSFGPEGQWRIGVIGRISPEKGQKEFLKAAELLLQHVPGARFLICGTPMFATSSYFDEVRTLARNLPIEFLGWRDDVGAVLAELDLLVIPSLEEGLSRVMIEAFSAGVPVVAFPVGGIPEGIEDNVTGFLSERTAPEALAARLCELMLGPASRLEATAINARRLWERSFTVRVYRDRITSLMESMVTTSRTTSSRSTPSAPALGGDAPPATPEARRSATGSSNGPSR